MTVTNRRIDPIRAGEVPGGLTTAARPFPAGTEWQGGVVFWSPCGTTMGVWSCAHGATEDKTDNFVDLSEPPTFFDPFLVYTGLEGCVTNAEVIDAPTEVGLIFDRGLSGALARQLMVSDPLVANPDLSTSATALNVTALSPSAAIGALLSAVEDCGGGEVMFHVPMVGLPTLLKSYIVDADKLGPGSPYRIGPYAVSVDEYPNVEPTGGTPASPNEVWVYMTRPVEYEVGTSADADVFTGRLNQSVSVAERLAILRFDPCCVYAVLMTIC